MGDYYNYITDGFTLQESTNRLLYSLKKTPKIASNTNCTISVVNRFDRRRLFFVPISQLYGVLAETKGFTPKDGNGQWFFSDQWTSEDWIGFYITCIHCFDEYLKNSLDPLKKVFLLINSYLPLVAIIGLFSKSFKKLSRLSLIFL